MYAYINRLIKHSEKKHLLKLVTFKNINKTSLTYIANNLLTDNCKSV